MRERLPIGVKMYTGDDFHYPDLILGEVPVISHALLGIFDGIAAAAAAAVSALDQGEIPLFRQILEPTVPLARHIFRTPTYYYKTGLTFLSYLNGHQNHFRMVGGLESGRSVIHLCERSSSPIKQGVRDPDLARADATLPGGPWNLGNRMRMRRCPGGTKLSNGCAVSNRMSAPQ